MTDKKYSRKTKNELYKEEQYKIFNKLNTFLNINNNYFVIDDYDNFPYKNDILNLVNDIKKYFVYNRWSYFNNDGDYISLIKSIYNEMKYDIISRKIQILNKSVIFCYIINDNIKTH